MTQSKIAIDKLNLWFGDNHVLKDVTFAIPANAVTAIMGPSGCGKSTLLRTINRMNDLILGTRVTGDIVIDGESIFADSTDVIDLRKRVGMVFQKPNPFPKSIYENIAFGPHIHHMGSHADIHQRVERALRATEVMFATHESSRRRGRVDLPLPAGPCAMLAMVASGELKVG